MHFQHVQTALWSTLSNPTVINHHASSTNSRETSGNMESENDHPYENGSNGPSTDASDTIQPGIAEGLYILTNKKTRTLLDLSGGNTASRADIIGWERNTNHVIDHQLWALKQVDSNGSYRLMTFRGGTYLDLEGGKQEDNSQVFAYNYVGKVDARLHQEWIISEEPEGFYSLRCVKTGTFLEIHEGKPDNGIKATCSKRVDGGDHQLWDLERATRTTVEIKSILKSWKPDILSRLFQPHDDKNEYFILPGDLRNTIWNGTKLQRQAVRKGSFDYDSFVIKAKDAVHTWARDRLRVDGYYVLFGIVFGQAQKGPKAYNWYLSPDMQALVFFDAQTSKEYTTSGLEHFGFEPSFVMF